MNIQLHIVAALATSLLLGCGETKVYEAPALPPPPPPVTLAPSPAQGVTAAQPPPPPAPPRSTGDSSAAALPSPSVAPPQPAASAPPPTGALVQTYPTGSWVYITDRGWVWIPADTSPVEVDGNPYVYLYTPVHGWTWYVSPWGWGPYHYGVWIGHPWHPEGWHGEWVAHPHVTVRLGGERHFGGEHHRR